MMKYFLYWDLWWCLVYLENLNDLFDSYSEVKQVDLQLNLFQQNLIEGGDVIKYISKLKNIKQDIIKDGFSKIEDSFYKIEDSLMITILISRLLESYKHFLDTLQILDKLENITSDKLSELLANHDKTLGKKKQPRKDVLVVCTSKHTNNDLEGKSIHPTRNNENQIN